VSSVDEYGPVSERHARARMVDPRYTEGPLVRVARADNQAHAELIQNLLLEEGVPSMLRRTRGFDVPDMLAAGPRDVMVAASGADAAREVLLDAQLLAPADAQPVAERLRAVRVLCGLLATVVLVAVVAWLGTELLA
jgi:hypothetical protein